jgi:hypothetical protein
MPGKRAAAIALLAVAVTGCAQASARVAASSTASPPVASSITAAPATSAPASDLQAALNQLPLPPGSVRLQAAAQPSQPSISVANAPGKVTASGYWRSPLSRLATLSWLAAHLPPTWTAGEMGALGTTISTAEYDRQPTAALKGPNYTFSIEDTTGGASVVVTAWEIPLPAKAADESISGVTGASLSTKDEVAPMDAPPLRRVTLTAAQATQLASEINGLTVDDGSAHGCAEGSPAVVMAFAIATGLRTFLYSRNCHSVQVVGDDKSPVLEANAHLVRRGDHPAQDRDGTSTRHAHRHPRDQQAYLPG